MTTLPIICRLRFLFLRLFVVVDGQKHTFGRVGNVSSCNQSVGFVLRYFIEELVGFWRDYEVTRFNDDGAIRVVMQT